MLELSSRTLSVHRAAIRELGARNEHEPVTEHLPSTNLGAHWHQLGSATPTALLWRSLENKPQYLGTVYVVGFLLATLLSSR